MVGAFASGKVALASVGVGGAISIGSFELYRTLASALLRPDRRRRGWVGLVLIWVVKWPALWVGLWWAMGAGYISVEWLCAGLGVIPAGVMVLGARLVRGELHGQRAVGAEGRQ